nr:hypothetical protein [Tanacetum cinerariifolium]
MTRVDVMKKHGYGYLREIEVRRADNVLYTFKEGDFLRIRLNDIEDMLILVAQNRLTNLSGDDVADFAIALKMFIRSLVIQKRVGDLQLDLESYQKVINVTRLDTDCDGIPKRPTMYLNLWRHKVVRYRYSNPMIQPKPEGSTQGYPLVSVEVLRTLKDGGEGTYFHLSQRFIAACSYLTDNYKDIMKAQVHVSRLSLL